MKKFYALLALLCLVAGPVWAQEVLDPTANTEGCKFFTLCDDQAAGTTCVTGTDENIVRGLSEWFWSACADTSDSTTAWTVDIYKKTWRAGYGTVRSRITYLGALTPATPCVDWTGHGGDVHAVLGGTLTGGVTVIVQACKP